MIGEREGGGGLAEHIGSSDTFLIRALLIVVPLTYAAWYGAAAVLSIAFGINGGQFLLTFLEPFDHIQFTPAATADDWRPLVHWLAMVLTLTMACPWLIYFACRPHKRATECSTAFNALHFFLCTTLTQETPENWIWWATVMPCGVFMGRMAEFMIAMMPPPKKRRSGLQSVTPYSKSG